MERSNIAAMKPEPETEITVLLRAWSEGDQRAEQKLWRIVFAELKRLARYHLVNERPGHTLQSGALVNEAYIRLVDWNNTRWENRAQFFAMSGRIMRQILVDYARSRQRQKRPSPQDRVWCDDATFISDSKSEDVIALDDALKQLAEIHPRKSEVVELRFFAGLSVEETAELLKVSRLTVIRDWNFARAWLRMTMHRQD